MKSTADEVPGLADWQRLAQAFGLGATPGVRPPLEQAGAAFARFAEQFAALGRPAPGAAAAGRAEHARELAALAERFVASSFPAWPTPPGADADWVRALEGYSRALAAIGADTAQRFAARLAAPGAPLTLRGAFDAWIESAEAAFQASAHGDAFVGAQTRLINEFVRQRARQQALVEQAVRAVGLPTRAEVDALHDALRALSTAQRAQPAATAAAAPPPATRPRRPAPGAGGRGGAPRKPRSRRP